MKEFVKEILKNGRNELCQCGSGKKYKKCCIDNEYNENKRIEESNRLFLEEEKNTRKTDAEIYPQIVEKIKNYEVWNYNELIKDGVITEEEWYVLSRQNYRLKKQKKTRKQKQIWE